MGKDPGPILLALRLVEFVLQSVVAKHIILALRRKKQEDCCEFGASFVCNVRHCLKQVFFFLWSFFLGGELNTKSFPGLLAIRGEARVPRPPPFFPFVQTLSCFL